MNVENKNIYSRTGMYRGLYSIFDLFFEEINATYGRSFCREVKREALQDYSRTGDLLKLDELAILNRVNLRHPQIRENIDQQCKMILGAAA